jgi:hypothetical protein
MCPLMGMRHAGAVFVVFLAVASPSRSAIVTSPLNAPSDPIAGYSQVTSDIGGIQVGPSVLLIRTLFVLYQRGVGPMRGTLCPMLPSCSEYARISVVRHGLLFGSLMAADRLHRCGHDLYLYPRLWSTSRGWCYEDPPG